ncbi:hypothetical protein B0H14DRAFT_1047877 [Mycena olivaceomarginata]|nr:hypothetical protein B0H14DRAFT_1047877 [Mycena olivaceomarginata]
MHASMSALPSLPSLNHIPRATTCLRSTSCARCPQSRRRRSSGRTGQGGRVSLSLAGPDWCWWKWERWGPADPERLRADVLERHWGEDVGTEEFGEYILYECVDTVFECDAAVCAVFCEANPPISFAAQLGSILCPTCYIVHLQQFPRDGHSFRTGFLSSRRLAPVLFKRLS